MHAHELLTAKDVAAIARVHLKTFYRWCALGLGPREVWLGRSRRYREQDIARWLAARDNGDVAGGRGDRDVP